MIACGNHVHATEYEQHHHNSVLDVKLCFANPQGINSIEEDVQEYLDNQDTEYAYEDVYYDEDAAYDRYRDDVLFGL